MDIINVCVQFVKLCLCSSFPVPPVVFVLCRCLIFSHANEEYLNLKQSLTDRKHLCVFPCRLFSHLTMFNPQHSHDINYSFHPQTACECVGDSVCVCVHTRAFPFVSAYV